jgi:hypothetical protein
MECVQPQGKFRCFLVAFYSARGKDFRKNVEFIRQENNDRLCTLNEYAKK